MQRACALVDGHLKRPEGLLWEADQSGFPAYMIGAGPSISITSSSAIAPGAPVTVPYAGFGLTDDAVGEAVVLDFGSQTACETCTVIAIAPGTVTLNVVRFAHASGVSIDFGRLINEERQIPDRRSVTQVSRNPIRRLVSGQGRYGYGRRSEQSIGIEPDFNLLSDLTTLGGPPQWQWFDPTQTGVSVTGDLWIPAGLYAASFTEVRLWYVAGWTYATLPFAVRQAVANIVSALQDADGASPNIRSRAAADTSWARFSASVIDTETQSLLTPYKARSFF